MVRIIVLFTPTSSIVRTHASISAAVFAYGCECISMIGYFAFSIFVTGIL